MEYKSFSFEKYDTTPVIIGVSQMTIKEGPPIDPLTLLGNVCKLAVDDSISKSPNVSKESLLSLINSVSIVNVGSWTYSFGNNKLPSKLSEIIGVDPTHLEYSPVGGNMPQKLINKACLSLESREITGAIISGCECVNFVQKILQGGAEKHQWPEGTISFQPLEQSHLEIKYRMSRPIRTYPLIETALRAKSGRTPDEHSKYIGELFERFSDVASKNPHSWFQQKRSAQEISTPSKSNRYVVYPYTKLMSAFPMVNQSAAVILTTVGNAKKLGISQDTWVFPMGGAHFDDITNFSERTHLYESPGIRHSADLALKQSGLTLSDIHFFDIYSCFPSAVQVAMQEIGISHKDKRQLTVTGGLPFFGGPGNNYSMHAIVTAVGMIREKPESKALINNNGMYLTKHAVGVYGKSKPKYSWKEQFAYFPSIQSMISSHKLPPLVEIGNGPFLVEAFIIQYSKTHNTPTGGVLLGKLLNTGERTFAEFDKSEIGSLVELQQQEIVGKIAMCEHDPNLKLNKLKFKSSKL